MEGKRKYQAFAKENFSTEGSEVIRKQMKKDAKANMEAMVWALTKNEIDRAIMQL